MVGAGYIAVEMAGIFKSLGSDVTQILRKDKALRSFDTMIVDTVTEELEHLGINLGQAHHIFSRFMNPRIYIRFFFSQFYLFCLVSLKKALKPKNTAD